MRVSLVSTARRDSRSAPPSICFPNAAARRKPATDIPVRSARCSTHSSSAVVKRTVLRSERVSEGGFGGRPRTSVDRFAACSSLALIENRRHD